HLQLASDVDWGGLNPGASKKLQNDFGFYNGVFSYGGSTKLLNTQFPPEELQFQEVMNQRKTLALPPPAPLSVAEQQQAQLWTTNLQDYVTQQSLGFVLGHRPFSQWNDFVSELKQRNMDDYMNLVTTAYQRFKKNHGAKS
ncbi:MAG: sugar ABC transporter substrate-binding protein, partial [Candidatus Dormibacteraeota bacterium]|nr:sugar ABC transporter substrate-binding protein [Candidatus Dormibacteraeota bacterium]